MLPSTMTLTMNICIVPHTGEALWFSLRSLNPHSNPVWYYYPRFKVRKVEPREGNSLAKTQQISGRTWNHMQIYDHKYKYQKEPALGPG